MDRWLKKMYVDTMESCASIRRKEIVLFETIWRDLEDTMLSEVSQTEKYKYSMISLTCGI